MAEKKKTRKAFVPEHLLKSDFPFRLHTPTHDSYYNVCDAHSHNNFFELVIVKSGSAIHNRNDSCTIVQSGDIFLLRPGEVHYYSDANAFSIYNLLYSDHFLQELPSAAAIKPQHWWGKNDQIRRLPHPNFFDVITLLEEIRTEQNAPHLENQAVIVANVIKVFTIIRRNSLCAGDNSAHADTKLRISQLVSTLDRKYPEEWSIERMAKQTGYSTASFRYYFKEIIQIPPMEYLLSLRLDKAALMLSNTSDSISNIVFACGFKDVSYFSRQFKKRFGTTPNGFRKACKSLSNEAKNVDLDWSGCANMSANVLFPFPVRK